MNLFFIPVIYAAVISFVASGLIVRYGKLLKIVDDPKSHKHAKVVHEVPVPRGGGIPIFLAVACGLIFILPGDKRTWGILAAITLLAITGFADDRYEEKISPYARLIVNVVAALCVIGVGIGIAFITNPWGGIIHLDKPQFCFYIMGVGHCIWILSDLFALVWLTWMQNIIGWSSGVDGQLPGFVIVAAVTIAILGLRNPESSQFLVIGLSGLIVGAYAGFLPWNWFPQKIMPGYGGKSIAGFLLGLLAIISGAKVGAMFLVLSVQFVDAGLVILKRLKEGRSIVWGGREHLHHILLDQGWSKRRIAVTYWLMSVVLGILALQLKANLKYFTMATVVLVLSGLIWWLQNFSIFSKQRDPGNGLKT